MDDDRLALALAFLNTRDGARDMLASARRAQRWLAGDTFVGVDADLQRLLPAMHELAAGIEPGEADVEEARALRDALLAWIDGESLRTPAPRAVSFAAADQVEGPALRPAARGILGIAQYAFLVLFELRIAGESSRLHRCHAEDCRWVFFDRSRNRSKVWCDMSGCGARAKARAYRARKTANPAPAG